MAHQHPCLCPCFKLPLCGLFFLLILCTLLVSDSAAATASISELILELVPEPVQGSLATCHLRKQAAASLRPGASMGCNDRHTAVHVPSNEDTSGTSPNHITHGDCSSYYHRFKFLLQRGIKRRSCFAALTFCVPRLASVLVGSHRSARALSVDH